jgi:hypothetical protein
MGDERADLEFAGGDVRMWLDQGVVMLKAVDPHYRDPVELNEDEAREIAHALVRLADLAAES